MGIPNFKMAAVKLSTDVIRAFVDSFDTILVDCDGVLWAGSKLISNSVETINFLKENGKQVFYVTNNSTKTRSQYLVRLLEIGYNAEEVFYVQLRVPVHINFNIDLFIS